MKKIGLSIFILLLWSAPLIGQHSILPLWPSPTSKLADTIIQREIGRWITYVGNPTIEVYLPSQKNANGKAMVICPGGGYRGLAYDWEGTIVAKWLNAKGIAAIVLKSRLPDRSLSGVKRHSIPFTDACRAVRTVRYNAQKWNIKKNQIGIMGFSAGGHLASTVGVHSDSDTSIESPLTMDEISNESAKPNFVALIYPVISMEPNITHKESKNALIGDQPDKATANYYSTEHHINPSTPPTLLIHASDDKGVIVDNSLVFYQNLVSNNVYAEMHIYPKGGHGFGMGFHFGHVQHWPERLINWLESIP